MAAGAGLAVLGGMFDPVHMGHIAAARRALDRLGPGRLKLIPCHQPAHRGSAGAAPQHRLAMLRIACHHHGDMEVDDCEIARGGVSYTVDTLHHLRREQKSGPLVLVLGMDSLNSLPTWHRWQELPTLCHFFVLARAGQRVSMEVMRQTRRMIRQVATSQQLFATAAGNMLLDRDFASGASSTAIRTALVSGQAAPPILDGEVAAYIRQHRLYRSANEGSRFG